MGGSGGWRGGGVYDAETLTEEHCNRSKAKLSMVDVATPPAA